MRCFVLGFLIAGCAPVPESSDRWEDVEYDLDTVLEGSYAAHVELEVEARVGPIVLGSELCVRDIVLLVEHRAVTGEITCDVPEVGEVTSQITGAVDAPLVDGRVQADGVDLEWQGGFTAPDAFFGEIFGTHPAGAAQIVWTGAFEAGRTGPTN